MTHAKRTSIAGTGAADRRRKRLKRIPTVKAITTKPAPKSLTVRKAAKSAAKRLYVPKISIDLTEDPADRRVHRMIRFGAVTVSNTSPDVETLVINVKAGRDALSRAKDAFTTPGVTLHHRDDVPTFRVDARDPKILIREIGGRMDRGRIIDGMFVPAE